MPRTRRRDAAPAPPGGSTLTGTTRLLRENLPRPSAPAPGGSAPSGAPAPSATPRKRRFEAIRRLEPKFIADIVSELKKVTWPTFAETRHLTLVVAAVAVTVGLFLGGVDLLFGWAVEKLFF